MSPEAGVRRTKYRLLTRKSGDAVDLGRQSENPATEGPWRQVGSPAEAGPGEERGRVCECA